MAFITKFTLALLFSLLLLLNACNSNPFLGEWDAKIIYTASDGSQSSDSFALKFDSQGQVFQNGKLYGNYVLRSNKRLKFFTLDRKIVFYADLKHRQTLSGEAIFIPNDAHFATWTAHKIVPTNR